MNVHIYKGDVGKSSIMSHMMNYMEVVGIILYSENRPYPNIDGAFMAPRAHVTPEDLASYIPNLLEDGGDWGELLSFIRIIPKEKMPNISRL
jgi:hypothetical protein